MATQKARTTGSGDGKTRRRRRTTASGAPVAAAAASLADFDFEGYSQQFKQRSDDRAANDASAYGVRVEPIAVDPGQTYWKVIGIHHLLPDENCDRHNAFVEVLDEAGRRIKDGALRVGWTWEGKTEGPADPKPLDKPDDEPATNVPIEKAMTVTLWVQDSHPSERVAGIHTRHDDEIGPAGNRNSRYHHSFYIVFQRTQWAGGETGHHEEGNGEPAGGSGKAPTPEPFRFLCWPTNHVRVLQPFGVNPEFYRDFNLPGHEGVDIEAAENEPIYCVAPGQVKMVNTPKAYQTNNHPYGVHVRVAHRDGYETIYAHCKELYVREGDRVDTGQILGLADHTGNVFGAVPDHLHLSLKRAGESTPGYPERIIDPMPFLRPLLAPFEGGSGEPLLTTPTRIAEKLGLNCNAPIDGHGAISPRISTPNLIRATGVGWVRLNFIVRAFSGPDDPQWIATYRQIIDSLRAQGLKIYGLIGAEAVTEDPGNQFRQQPPSDAVDNAWIHTYTQNFRKIVQRFGQDMAIVESFNEPNDWHRVPGDPIEWQQAWVDPGWFAIMLQRVYEAVRDLDVTLVSGPLLSTADGNDAAAYLPRVYEAGQIRFGWGGAGMPVPFAGVGFHPYVLRDSFAPQDEIPARYRQYLAEVRAVIGRYDDPGKPLFLSEIGWQNPDDRQAACMAVGLTCALDDPAVALCFWYGMQDDEQESYGLYRRDGLTPDHRKPAYPLFVALANDVRRVPAARLKPRPSAARFVAELDPIVDDTPLQPLTPFTKIWRLENTGATTWGNDYQFVCTGGQTMGAPHQIAVPLCQPGQSVDIAVTFTTPPAPGSYSSNWSLCDAQGRLFGQPVWTRILVTPPVAALGAPTAPLLPTPAIMAGMSPLVAAALGIIYQTYWLRVAAAAAAPNPDQAMQAAADDALVRIQALMKST